MKAPLQKLLPVLQQETSDMRESAAAKVLELGAVRLALHEAATRGQDAVRLRLPDLLNVTNTKAAKALVAWCAKEGLTLTWQTRSADLPEGRRVIVAEPEISWM